MSRGILMVSFGTMHEDTRRKTYDALKEDAAAKFTVSEIYSAWTSPTIRRKIKEREGTNIFDVPEALRRMHSDGIRDVAVISNYIINGYESEDLKKNLKEHRTLFDSIVCSKALLESISKIEELAENLDREFEFDEFKKSEAMVFMGHGSDHENHSAYHHLNQCFRNMGHENIFVACIEGRPTLYDILPMLSEYKKIKLHPLTFVAGEHVKSDMAGEGESWKCILENNGFQTECIVKGLGEYPFVRKMFLDVEQSGSDISF